jgi:hypothetical protein
LTPEGLQYSKELIIAWNAFVQNVSNLIEQGDFPK